MKKLNFYGVLLISLFGLSQFTLGQTSGLVSIDVHGKLSYQSDEKGNKIPDFTGVGYMNSETDIPVIPVVKTISAVSGDNYLIIQSH